MIKKIIISLLFSSQLFAESQTTADDVSTQLEKGVQLIAPTAQLKSNKPTPLEGISEIVIGNDVSGEVFYMSNDGKYFIQGKIIDTESKINLADNTKRDIRQKAINKFEDADRINFYPEKMKYHVTVFTDIDCGYCRKLHNQMSEYNDLGIGISYLLFPRSGIDSPSYDKAVTVWCSEDKNSAMTEAQLGKALELIECTNPVKDQYLAGHASGVNGTPNIVTDNGTLIPTYLPPDALLKRLQKLQSTQN